MPFKTSKYVIKEWVKSYRNDSKKTPSIKLVEKHLLLAKFFITANISIISCQNKHLRALCDETLGKYALVNDILPKLKTQKN